MATSRMHFLASDAPLFEDEAEDVPAQPRQYPVETPPAQAGAPRFAPPRTGYRGSLASPELFSPPVHSPRSAYSPSVPTSPRHPPSPRPPASPRHSALGSVLQDNGYGIGLGPRGRSNRPSPSSVAPSVASPSPVPGSPKRKATDELDPVGNILGNYRNDKNQRVTLSGPKRQRFLQVGRPDRFRNDDGWTIWALIKQKCFRPSYSTLPEDHVRLMVLHPGEGDQPIKVILVMAPLDYDCRYEALSYVWGEDLPLKPIVVYDRTMGAMCRTGQARPSLRHVLNTKVSVFLVRANLQSALRRLRQIPPKNVDGSINWDRYWDSRHFRILWVDAICLDQRNNDEKSRQLERMPQIYGMALQVIIWLGEGTESSDTAMDFIEELNQDERAGRVTTLDVSKKTIDSFLELMQCKWFGRRWIIQEVLFASDAALYYGKKSHNVERFYFALERVMRLLRDPHRQAQKVPQLQLANLEKVEAYGAMTIYKLQSELLELDNQGQMLFHHTLDDLVPRLTAFDAGDPRDVIFGVYSLARKTETTPLPPTDYKTSVLDVFAGFVEYSFDTTNQLDIICRHWAPIHTHLLVSYNQRERQGVKTHLPSWIPQLNEAPFGPPSDVFLGRINAAPLIGDHTPIYNATKGMKADNAYARFGKHGKPRVIKEVFPSRAAYHRNYGRELIVEQYDGTLEVKGIVLGRIIERSDRMIPEVIPRDALRLGGWRFSKFEGHNKLVDIPDQLWKTLIAKKHFDGSDADIGDKHACLAMLKEEDVQGDIRLDDLLRKPEFSTNLTRKNYLERVRVVCWNRRAFVGSLFSRDPPEPIECELFGLCPDATSPGDYVCLIYGLSVPVILREVPEVPRLGFEEPPRLDRHRKKQTPQITPQAKFLHTFHSGSNSNSRHQSRSPIWQTSPTFANPPGIHHSKSEPTIPTIQPPLFPSPRYYKVIGEAYVNGMMDGQAVHNPKYADSEQTFTLV